ncbi:MAG: hypothetical protein ABJF04_01970 [Reichenbachiella sp.]|uniref:hypothetical protein n=1 Tax=Reichenbachiella sp. TaxID=2184521 RepID=UPI003265A35B
MTLEPGYYKLKRGSSIMATYHFLRVYLKDGKKYYLLDHMTEQSVRRETAGDMHAEGYTIIKKYPPNNGPKYNKVKAKIQFEDEEGCQFEMVARSGVVLEYIFKLFPRLKKGFWT